MKPTFWVAIAGIALMTAGFFVDQAKQIPFVLRIVASRYVGANDAAQTLFTKNSLSEANRGFRDLAELYISQLPKRPPPPLFPTNFTREANVSTLMNGGPVTVIHMIWSGGQTSTWTQQGIQKSLDALLEASLSVWKFVLFPLGFLIECFAIFFDHRPFSVRKKAPEQKTSPERKTEAREPERKR